MVMRCDRLVCRLGTSFIYIPREGDHYGNRDPKSVVVY